MNASPRSDNKSQTDATGYGWFFSGPLDDSGSVGHVDLHVVPFRVGRRPDADISLRVTSVSKDHAELFTQGDVLYVRDLNSTNGTYVNGRRVEGISGLSEGDIVQFATVVFRVGRQEEAEPDSGTMLENACDQALALVQFDRLIQDRAVVPYYQPIVRLDDDLTLTGYEVLGRSRMFGLQTAGEMFATACQLNQESELSRTVRLESVEIAQGLPSSLNLFLNTHPIELHEVILFDSLRDVRRLAPSRPMTLEIHEAAITDPTTIRLLRETLTELDMQLAFDDFGAGQARLVELSEVRPDFLKFDMKLIQGIAFAPASRQQVVALLARMVNELGIVPLAEGVETEEDHLTLRQMGFGLGQGYFYGRPQAIGRIFRGKQDGLGQSV